MSILSILVIKIWLKNKKFTTKLKWRQDCVNDIFNLFKPVLWTCQLYFHFLVMVEFQLIEDNGNVRYTKSLQWKDILIDNNHVLLVVLIVSFRSAKNDMYKKTWGVVGRCLGWDEFGSIIFMITSRFKTHTINQSFAHTQKILLLILQNKQQVNLLQNLIA